MAHNPISTLFNIQFPIIQGGMVWCSGWKLASAVSNAGGLGLIGSGSMSPELLEEHILKCKAATQNPFGVNVPLLYPHAEAHIEMILKHRVPVVFTSAGNPSLFTKKLKENGCIVAHVIANTKFARKAEEAGVDALVAEGFEAGGHNGKEETTSFCLIPQIAAATNLPIIAAGGIYDGRSWLAAEALGASAIQVGTRFAASTESSAHIKYKQTIISAKEGDTQLTLKQLTPVRMFKNNLYEKLEDLISKGTHSDELKSFMGKGRSKKGVFEGDLMEGELEMGAISSLITKTESAKEIITNLVETYQMARKSLVNNDFLS
jgi:enoyl-[acyl-carrier protein] reductase II